MAPNPFAPPPADTDWIDSRREAAALARGVCIGMIAGAVLTIEAWGFLATVFRW